MVKSQGDSDLIFICETIYVHCMSFPNTYTHFCNPDYEFTRITLLTWKHCIHLNLSERVSNIVCLNATSKSEKCLKCSLLNVAINHLKKTK